jgi:hypothetical protein
MHVTGQLSYVVGFVLLPMPLNFPSAKELRKHTKRHWQEFNLASEHAESEYLALASAFCDGPCPNDSDECIRTCDNKLDRFREASGEFTVMIPSKAWILTYHILYPFGTTGVSVERTHVYATNRQYYEADCFCL